MNGPDAAIPLNSLNALNALNALNPAPLTVLRCGETALLVEVVDAKAVNDYRAALAGRPISGVTDVVAAARTLLVRFDPDVISAEALKRELRLVNPKSMTRAPGTLIEIEVVYDGEDLERVGELTGLGVAGVIDAHTSQVWTAAFCGFAPGFSYLQSEHPLLTLPRRETSRTAVPAGSVGLAGDFSAVYPRRSPGGWQLIGRTDAIMWSLDRESPALAPAGTRVRFIDAGR